MRLKRIEISTTELNRIENEWWNTNSDLIEIIWANSFELQQAIRLPYLKRMKSFFLDTAKQTPVKILEIGCGTGWVGRLVADESLHIIGTDFSESQINRAKEEAKRFNKDKFCQYELSDASTFTKDVDGVLIHAVLHHLSTEELNTFFNEFSKLKKGTKVFFYEPVFFEPNTKTGLLEKALNRAILFIKKYAFQQIEKTNAINKQLLSEWNKIYDDATKNGWYISPKEVPFYETEFLDYLHKYGIIKQQFIVNHTDLDIAQKLTLHNMHKPGKLYTQFIIPAVIMLEKQLFKRNFRPFIYRDQHLFVCYELIIK